MSKKKPHQKKTGKNEEKSQFSGRSRRALTCPAEAHRHKCIKPLALRPPANRRLRQRFLTTQANSGENRSYQEGHRSSDLVMLGGQNGEEQQAHAGCSKNWRSNGE